MGRIDGNPGVHSTAAETALTETPLNDKPLHQHKTWADKIRRDAKMRIAAVSAQAYHRINAWAWHWINKRSGETAECRPPRWIHEPGHRPRKPCDAVEAGISNIGVGRNPMPAGVGNRYATR
jgi:hypothetical protein